MIREQHLTGLPGSEPPMDAQRRPNLARAAQEFINIAVAGAAVDQLNLGLASAPDGISKVLPSFPAARLFADLVFGWPNYYLHPPNLIPPAQPNLFARYRAGHLRGGGERPDQRVSGRQMRGRWVWGLVRNIKRVSYTNSGSDKQIHTLSSH
jgi:hypothetical protein